MNGLGLEAEGARFGFFEAEVERSFLQSIVITLKFTYLLSAG